MKISVKAHPKAKKARRVTAGDESYEVWVNEAPDKGRANEAIVEAMSKHLQIAKSRFVIISGAASKNKIFEIL